MELTVENANLIAMKSAVINNDVSNHDMVNMIATLLVQHYHSELDGILNFLMIKEAIYSIHGQTRKDLSSFYALELLEKAKANKLNLTFNINSRFSSLQFELPRIEYNELS